MHHEALRGHLYICRDLKPDNVGFAADGTLKIFGASSARGVRVFQRSRRATRAFFLLYLYIYIYIYIFFFFSRGGIDFCR